MMVTITAAYSSIHGDSIVALRVLWKKLGSVGITVLTTCLPLPPRPRGLIAVGSFNSPSEN